MLNIGLKSLLAMLASLTVMLVLLPEREESNRFGWVRDPAAAEEFAASLELKSFGETAAFRQNACGDENVFLWESARLSTGSMLPARDQGNVGACVGFGTAAAIEYLQCEQMLHDGGRFRELSPEIIYAGSRIEVGGGKLRGDGSVGAWAAKFVRDYGTLPRGRYPNLDLTQYSPKLCRKLGSSGVPDKLEPLCKQHPVKTVTRVSSFDECRAALQNGYPLIVCSDQGFEFARDSEGFCKPRGTWMHCLAVIGVRGGDRPGAFLLNSWGANTHTGPRGMGDPPSAGFWADAEVVDRMLKQGDSWAFSQYEGFPAKPANWRR